MKILRKNLPDTHTILIFFFLSSYTLAYKTQGGMSSFNCHQLSERFGFVKGGGHQNKKGKQISVCLKRLTILTFPDPLPYTRCSLTATEGTTTCFHLPSLLAFLDSRALRIFQTSTANASDDRKRRKENLLFPSIHDRCKAWLAEGKERVKKEACSTEEWSKSVCGGIRWNMWEIFR